MKTYVDLNNKYRLSREINTSSGYCTIYYYRLYEKFMDDFGNDNYKQVWTGGTSDFSGKFAEWLFVALNLDKAAGA
jgi:hypothetical protein